MKKLICAVVVAGSMFVMAEEAAPAAAKVPEVSAPQREKIREMTQVLAKRRAEMEAKKLEIVKKYVPDEDKAKALIAELQAAMKSARRPMPRPLPRAKKAPEGAK